MKSTGMVRKIDELGRIVIPIEIRNTMGLECRDALEIFTEGDRIVLTKYQPTCLFCSNKEVSFSSSPALMAASISLTRRPNLPESTYHPATSMSKMMATIPYIMPLKLAEAPAYVKKHAWLL